MTFCTRISAPVSVTGALQVAVVICTDFTRIAHTSNETDRQAGFRSA